MHIHKILLTTLLLCVALTGSSLGQNGKPAKSAPKPAGQAAPVAVPVAAPTAPPAAPPAAASPTQTIDFGSPISSGNTVAIKGTKSTVSIYKVGATDTACGSGGYAAIGSLLDLKPASGTGTTKQFEFDSNNPQPLTLVADVNNGDNLCLVAVVGDGQFFYSPKPALVGSKAAPPPKINFDGIPATLSTSVSVKGGAAKDLVAIYAFAANYKPKSSLVSATSDKYCAPIDLPNATDKLASGVALTGPDSQAITLQRAISAGEQLCILDQPSSGDPEYSYFATVKDPATTAHPDFTGKLWSGDKSIIINGTSGDQVSVYAFDSSENEECETLLKAYKGTLLPIAGNGSNSTSTNSTQLSSTSPPPYTISLVSPLQAGIKLCLKQTDSKGRSPQYSSLLQVNDFNNPYPRVRTFYTAGVMINNQYTSNSSGSSSGASSSSSGGASTGAAYLDFGMAFLPRVETTDLPGFNTSISGRFSAIPVAAPSASSSSSSNNGTLNILSSQESARILGSAFLPVPRWKNVFQGNYAFFTAPLIKAGFTTLLNPSATSTSSSGTAAANFAPVYWQYSSGLRAGYRQYPTANKDAKDQPTPRTIAQVDITIGKYSNLQSYICNPNVSSGTSTTLPTNTVCFIAPSGSSTTYTLDQSRVNLYRMEVEGFFLFPGTPFVVGFDANLPQSALAPRNLDILNKAPGNVAVYFGVSGSLTSLFNSLKLAGSSQ